MNAKRWLHFLVVDVPENLSTILIVAIWICVLISVFGRYIFHISTSWADELSRLGLVWSVFMGTAAGVSRGIHTSVDFLVKKLPKPFQSGVKIILDSLIAMMAFVMVYYGWKFIVRMGVDRSTTVFGFNRTLFFWPAVLSGVFILLNLLLPVIDYLCERQGGKA